MARSPLDTLATDLVGDNGKPNLYFVTHAAGHTLAVFTDRDSAVDYAEHNGADVVEDRAHGVIWSEEHGEEDMVDSSLGDDEDDEDAEDDDDDDDDDD